MPLNVIHILAKNLESAKKHARDTGILNIRSGTWLQSYPLYQGKRTYSFKIKEF